MRFTCMIIALSAIVAAGLYAEEPALKLGLNNGHTARLNAIVPDSGSGVVMTAGYDNQVKWWEPATGRLLRTVSVPGNLCAVALVPGTQRFLVATGYYNSLQDDGPREDPVIHLIDSETGKTVREFKGFPQMVVDLRLDASGTRLYASGDMGDLYCVDMASGKMLYSQTLVDCYGPGDDYHPPQYALMPGGQRILLLETAYARVEENGKVPAHLDQNPSLVFLDLSTGNETPAAARLDQAVWYEQMAVSPDGAFAALNANDGSIVIVDLSDRASILATVKGFKNEVQSMRFSPGGQDLFVYDISGSLFRYDLVARAIAGRCDTKGNYQSEFGFTADGGQVLVADRKGAISAYAAADFSPLRVWSNDTKGVLSLAFSPDGATLATVNTAGRLFLWDWPSGRLLRSFENARPYRNSVRWAADGRTLIFLDNSGVLGLLDAKSGVVKKKLGKAEDGIVALALSPDGRYLATATERKGILLWDVNAGQAVRSFVSGDAGFMAVAFSRDGKQLYGGTNADGTVVRWNLVSGKELSRLQIGYGAICDLAPSPDGATLAVGQGVFTMVPEPMEYIAVVSADLTGTVTRFSGSRRTAYDLAWTENGAKLCSSDEDGMIVVWDAQAGTVARRLAGHENAVYCIAMDQSGKKMVSGSQDGTFRAWDLASGSLLRITVTTALGEWLSYTPDGYFDGSDRGIKVLAYAIKGTRTYSIDQFSERYARPDIVAVRITDPFVGRGTDLTKGFAPPPALELAVLGQDADGRARVRVVARDQGGGIDGVRLFHNGKAVGEDARGIKPAGEGKMYARDYEFLLAPGRNELRAIGFSRDRTESAPAEATITHEAKNVAKPTLFLVAAGADNYRNAAYNLNFAVADARGFSKALASAAGTLFSKIETLEVYGADLTRQGLTKAFDTVRARALPQDEFVFFYAGHGIAVEEVGGSVFHFVLPAVTTMNDPDKLRKDGLSAVELRDMVAGIAANKQMLLVDACNSGAFLSGYALRGAAEENALAQLQRSSGVALFSASTDKQFANEVAELGHGLFTWALIQGMAGAAAGQDGRITAASLKGYIDMAVPDLAVKYRGAEQFPLARLNGQDFPIGMK